MSESMPPVPSGEDTGPVTLDMVLRDHGPYFNGRIPGDAEVFARLDTWGHVVHQLPSITEREFTAGKWREFFRTETVPGMDWREADRLVKVAMQRGSAGSQVGGRRAYTLAELATLPEPPALIRGILDTAALVTLYGPSGVGKTFAALDLALSVAAGIPWHGRAVVTPGPVLYVLAEGRGHFLRRVAAWKQEHGVTGDVPAFRVMLQPVPLLDPEAVTQLVADLAAWSPRPVLIVFDTLAWCMAGGDENSTADMSAAVAAVGRLREATSATVLVVHHTGWADNARERGSGALRGATDSTLSLKLDGAELVLAADKVRDDLPFAGLRFHLAPVAQSVVLRLVLGSESGGLTPAARAALDTLQSITTYPGEWVELSRWKAACCADDGSAHRAQMGTRTFYDSVRVLNMCGLLDDEGERLKRKVRHRISDTVES